MEKENHIQSKTEMANENTTNPDGKTTPRQNPCWINIQNYLKHRFFFYSRN